jgi:hypothetical protein
VKSYPHTGQQVIYSGLLSKPDFDQAEITGRWTMNDPHYQSQGLAYDFKIKKDYLELSGSEGEGSGSD